MAITLSGKLRFVQGRFWAIQSWGCYFSSTITFLDFVTRKVDLPFFRTLSKPCERQCHKLNQYFILGNILINTDIFLMKNCCQSNGKNLLYMPTLIHLLLKTLFPVFNHLRNYFLSSVQLMWVF